AKAVRLGDGHGSAAERMGAEGDRDDASEREPAAKLGDRDRELAAPLPAASQPEQRREVGDAEDGDQRDQDRGDATGGRRDAEADRGRGTAGEEQEERGGEARSAIHRGGAPSVGRSVEAPYRRAR